MTAIAYSDHRFPPCPTVRVRFSYTLEPERKVVAALDTGADRTVVPISLLREAGAWETRRSTSCVGYDGLRRHWSIYRVNVRILEPRWPEGVAPEFTDLEVFGVPDDEGKVDVLLGRDILAAWHLHLDGPNARYRVE